MLLSGPVPPPPEPSGMNVKSRMTISTFWPLEGGASKSQRFMPSGKATWGMLVEGFVGA